MQPLTAFALLPVLLPQALWVVARAQRLPEPRGPRSGQVGEGTPLRLLILGDSSAAGVGVAHQSQALSGRLVAQMSQASTVCWTLWAQSGLTSSGVLRRLASEHTQPFDAVILALGVNDVKNGVSLSRWTANYTELLHTLRARFGAPHIFASGIPPLGQFPLLPRPLRTVLGARAKRFDRALASLCAATDNVLHLPFDLPLDPTQMASDGFHPGPDIYDIWAARLATAIRASQRN